LQRRSERVLRSPCELAIIHRRRVGRGAEDFFLVHHQGPCEPPYRVSMACLGEKSDRHKAVSKTRYSHQPFARAIEEVFSCVLSPHSAASQ
jgi:hypothetical protein